MANICGLYTVSAIIPNAEYEFAGNNRAATFTGGDDNALLQMVCFNAPSSSGSFSFPKDGKIIIKRARIIAEGAEGAKNAPGELAGKFFLCAVRSDTPNKIQDSVMLKFDRWGDWIDSNVAIEPYKEKQPAGAWDYCHMGVFSYGNQFTVDDYDVSAAFVGQKMGVRLEMVLDCGAGLYDGDEHKIY